MKKYLFILLAFLSIFLFFSCSQNSEEIVEPTSQIEHSIPSDVESMDIVAQDESEIEIENYVAYVEEISGDVVTVNNLGNIRLEEGSLLGVGERILTLKNASLTLVFEDDSVVRLGENSSFTIETHQEDETKTILNKGSLWGRILRPVGSENDFKVVASDVSATVRGTSIFVEIDEETKLTQLSVIDSYSDQGVVVTKDDEEIILKPEEQISFSEEKKLEKRKIQIQKLLKEREFVRENTKRDIVHMKRIVEKRELSGNKDEKTLEKIQKEIKNTLPKDEEVESFFSNEELKKSISGASDVNINNIEENIVGLILKDEIITSVKKESGNKQVEETIKEIISDDFSSTKTQEVIEKATKKAEKLEVKQTTRILKKANIEQVDVAEKIKKQEEIEKQKRAQELKRKQELKEQEERKKQEELERQEKIRKQKEEARLKKEAADNLAFEEARRIEREKQQELEKQRKIAEDKKQQILRENEKARKLKEKQEEEKRLEKQKLLAKQEQEKVAKQEQEKKNQEIKTVTQKEDTKVLGDISKILDQGISEESENKQEVKTQVNTQLTDEKKQQETNSYNSAKKTLYNDIYALKGQKIEILSEIKGIKSSLKFSEIGEVLEEDEKFAKQILNFLGSIEKKLSSSYDPEKLELSVSELSSGESLDFFKKQSILVGQYYSEVYSDLEKVRTEVKDKRESIKKRESAQNNNIKDTTQKDDIVIKQEQEIKDETVKVVENIKITSSTTGVTKPLVKNTFFEEPKLNLRAQVSQDNKNVKLNWAVFEEDEDEKFTYYKLVRSSINSKPVYPDDNTIAVKDTLSTSYHKDTNLTAGVYYYRVCVLTELNNRYCSNVQKVEIKEILEEEESVEEVKPVEIKPISTQVSNTLFTDTNLFLKAKMYEHNGYVELTWSKFDIDEKFKYYKLVRSSTNSKPVYPDDTTIKVGGDINMISHEDYDSNPGKNYYRVCVVTELNNRYCSNVVTVENNIAQKVEDKKNEFLANNNNLEKNRNELLTKKELVEEKLNFSNLKNVNQNDNYFVEEYSKKLTHVKNNLAEYNFDNIANQISEISKISQFDDFYATLESIENNLGKISNNLNTIEDEVITKREEIKSRQSSSIGTIDVIDSTSVK